MTEIEERRRKQAVRTLITEIFMFIVIVVLVVVLAFVAMGYRIDFEKGVEHSGLVQINSIPTGAAITIDGEGIFLPTNQSRTMVSGEHEIALSRDGFTGWSKSINVVEGMMYRLGYPRLYKEDREATTISLTLESEKSPEPDALPTATPAVPTVPAQVFISPDRKVMLFTFAGSSVWRYINLNDGEPKARAVSFAGLNLGEVELISWLDSNSRLIARSRSGEVVSYFLLNIHKPSESVNLTTEFAIDFSSFRVESSDKLLVLDAAGNLREVNLSSGEISKVLLTNVDSFATLNSFIVYASTSVEAPEKKTISTMFFGEEPVLVAELATSEKIKFTVNEYYGDYYLAINYGDKFSIYAGDLPTAGSEFSDKMQLKASADLAFTPLTLKVRGDGELITAENGPSIAVFDAENFKITNFVTESNPSWISEFDFATVKDGWLTVHDFDHSNPHALAENSSVTFPATISGNDRYLYYFDENLTLTRLTIK